MASRLRWALAPGKSARLEFKKAGSALTAAAAFQAEYPAERFVAGAIGTPAVDGGALWSEAQIERRKAFWKEKRTEEVGKGEGVHAP